jgi:hypothetical protein
MKQYHVPHWRFSGSISPDVPMNIREIEERLPHGSGINGDWHFEESQRMIRAFNVYSAMDEFGGYCHDYRFVVDILKVAGKPMLDNFRVRLLSRKLKCCGYDLRSYLDDTIYPLLTA